MGLRITAPNLLLPWHAAEDEDRRFWRILGWCLLPFVLLSVVIPFIETPEPTREELEELPPQLARVVLEEKEIPKPPPKEEPKPEEEPEKPVEEKEPEPKPEPEPEPEPVERVQKAREKARQSGVLQFADALAEMRDSIDVSDVSEATITRNNGEAAKLDRALIASRADAASGGIDTSQLSRNTGGVALAGRETTQVESKLAQAGSTPTRANPGAGSDQVERTDESIRKVIDRNKSALYNIYNRALRRDPTLQGKLVVQIVIEPNGTVSSAEVISSALNNEELENKILLRIRFINFGAEDVSATTVNYTFDFLPS